MQTLAQVTFPRSRYCLIADCLLPTSQTQIHPSSLQPPSHPLLYNIVSIYRRTTFWGITHSFNLGQVVFNFHQQVTALININHLHRYVPSPSTLPPPLYRIAFFLATHDHHQTLHQISIDQLALLTFPPLAGGSDCPSSAIKGKFLPPPLSRLQLLLYNYIRTTSIFRDHPFVHPVSNELF